MGYSAKWKTLEDLSLQLRKKGCEIPASTINDLRNAKVLIRIVEEAENKGDTAMELEEILGSVEADLITEALSRLKPEEIDEWLRRLDEAGLSACEVKAGKEETFITGVPRDQQWIRVEPMPNLPAEKLEQIAKANSLSANQQKDGRLIVYGQQESIKAFLKKMAEEAEPKNRAHG